MVLFDIFDRSLSIEEENSGKKKRRSGGGGEGGGEKGTPAIKTPIGSFLRSLAAAKF